MILYRANATVYLRKFMKSSALDYSTGSIGGFAVLHLRSRETILADPNTRKRAKAIRIAYSAITLLGTTDIAVVRKLVGLSL